jgi:hypothetical protein
VVFSAGGDAVRKSLEDCGDHARSAPGRGERKSRRCYRAQATKGINGTTIEPVIIDEAGGTTKQVTEYRNLVQRQNVDAVIGYISSGDCLAIAPLADELKRLTIFFDCGTPRIFEDASYKYLFRTGAHAAMDNVAAARYLLARKSNVQPMLPGTRCEPAPRVLPRHQPNAANHADC